MKVTSPVLRRERASNRSFLFGKGTESDHSGSDYIMGNGHTIPGLKMAPKVFVIICDVELGKPYVLPILGRNSVRRDDGTAGRGNGKKQMTICNELYRGSRFALTERVLTYQRCFIV